MLHNVATNYIEASLRPLLTETAAVPSSRRPNETPRRLECPPRKRTDEDRRVIGTQWLVRRQESSRGSEVEPRHVKLVVFKQPDLAKLNLHSVQVKREPRAQ